MTLNDIYEDMKPRNADGTVCEIHFYTIFRTTFFRSLLQLNFTKFHACQYFYLHRQEITQNPITGNVKRPVHKKEA